MDVFPSPQTPYETKGPLRRRELKYVIPGLVETMTNIVKTHLRLMVEKITKATTKNKWRGLAESLIARLYRTPLTALALAVNRRHYCLQTLFFFLNQICNECFKNQCASGRHININTWRQREYCSSVPTALRRHSDRLSLTHHVKLPYRILEKGRGKRERKSCRFNSYYGGRFSFPPYKVP